MKFIGSKNIRRAFREKFLLPIVVMSAILFTNSNNNFLISNSFADNFSVKCEYTTRSGKRIIVDDYNQVPRIYRGEARCIKVDNSELVSASNIDLKRQEANDVVNTSLGKVNLKWSKDIKSLLGKNPQRVISNSMNTVSRIINQEGFSEKLSNMNQEWNIVFMGENIPNNQVPSYLITNCHPGWMVPPSDIYIATYRIYKGCSGEGERVDPEKELEHVLLHELGHAIEYKLLTASGSRDLKRSEGFATWFAMYASKYSPLLNSSELLSYYKNMAKIAIENSPKSFNFSGSVYDYARSSMYFYTIEQKQGVSGIVRLYDLMNMGKSFVGSVANMLNTSEVKIESKLIW